MRILVVLFAGFRAPFFCIPALRGSGAVVVISQKKPAREPISIMPFTGVIPHTGPWRQSPGEGPGRELPPRRQKPTGPSLELPRRSGRFRGDSPGGAWPARRPHAPLSSLPRPACASRSSPAPRRRQCRWYPRKGEPGRPAPILFFSGVIPCIGSWWG